MKGENAYKNYCQSFNDCALEDLPRFNIVQEYISHAKGIELERDFIFDDGELDNMIQHIGCSWQLKNLDFIYPPLYLFKRREVFKLTTVFTR